MKFKEITKIKDVYSPPYFWRNEMLIYNTNYDLLTISDKMGTKKLIKMDRDYSPVFIENDIYFYIEGTIQKLKESNDLEITWLSKIGKAFLHNNLIHERNFNENSNSLNYYCYDYKNKMLLWNRMYQNARFTTIIGDKLFLTDLNTTFISLLDEMNGNILWSIDFETNAVGKIFAYNDILIALLGPFKNLKMIGIDFITGTKLWEIYDCHNHYIQDPQTGLLYNFNSCIYQIIDPVKGIVIFEKNMYNECEQHKISPFVFAVSNNSLYFSSCEYSTIKFGRINLDNHQIEFVQSLGYFPGSRIFDSQFYQGRIYILDNTQTLHIFEEQ